jgi:hypothetical protein
VRKQDQKTFDTVVQHLRKQGKRALTDKGGCAYRGLGGTKCAVGVLIPDDKYSESMEGLSANLLIANGYVDVFSCNLTLLESLQSIHDDKLSWWAKGGFSEYGERRLANLARTHLLVYTPPGASK